MTISLNLSAETEAALRAQAESCGLTVAELVETIINSRTAAPHPQNPSRVSIGQEDIERVIDEIFDTVPLPPGVGKGVLRRENWYR